MTSSHRTAVILAAGRDELHRNHNGNCAATSGMGTVRPSFAKALAPCNFPFLFIFAAQISSCLDRMESGTIQGTNSPTATHIKYLLTAWLACSFVWNTRTLKPWHITYLGVLGAVFAWNICFNTYDLEASFVALFRYCTPLLFLFYGWFHRHRMDCLVSAVFAITIANDIVQCVMYATYFFTGTSVVPMGVIGGALPRASGAAGFVAFGLMNFTSAVLAYYYVDSRARMKYCAVFLAFAVGSFAFKMIPALFLFGMVLIRPRGPTGWAPRILAAATCVAAIWWVESATGILSQQAVQRYERYGLDTDSRRRESYRVMFESLAGGNILGEGLGCFGGPVSITYNSPTYSKYSFHFPQWESVNTTDAYYPHLFVELGLFGGLFYLGMFLLPVIAKRNCQSLDKMTYFLLCFSLGVNGVASFAIQSFDSMIVTALLFGLLCRHKTTRVPSNANTGTSRQTTHFQLPHTCSGTTTGRGRPPGLAPSNTTVIGNQ